MTLIDTSLNNSSNRYGYKMYLNPKVARVVSGHPRAARCETPHLLSCQEPDCGLPRDELGRPTSAILDGSFTLAADAKWRYIDILPDKSQLTSEAQGELPSQTQLNKLVAVHPGVGADASAAAAYINNTDNVFVIEDMKGNFRVLGNDKWSTKATA